MIVVDTNVISYFYLNGEYSDLAERLFLKTPEWSAPLLWRSEFRNVLSFYIRNEIISITDAFQIYGEAEKLLHRKEYEVNTLEVLELSRKSGCSAYDCEFVNLAQDLNIPLITMDKKILHNFSDLAFSIPEYIDPF